MGEVACTERSKTGHEVRLFGGEGIFGYFRFSMFTFDEADVFFYAYLMPIREVCRQIIGRSCERRNVLPTLNKYCQILQIR